MELQKGRPLGAEGRLDKELRSYDLLDRLGIEYERADHEPAMTMEVCAGIDRVLGVRICKNLFLCNRQKTDFYLLIMPDDKPFRTKELSAQIGSARLSFADAEAMEELLDVTPGSVSVLGLANDREHRVRLLIDEELLREPYFGCHPCINTSSLRFSTKALIESILPTLGYTPTVVRLSGSETI